MFKCRKPLEGGGTIWYADLEKNNIIVSQFISIQQEGPSPVCEAARFGCGWLLLLLLLLLQGENKVKSYFVGFLQNNYMIVDFVQLDFDDRFNK